MLSLDHGVDFQEVGRAMFFKFAFKINAILERQGYDDEFVWSHTNDIFLSKAFIEGWTPMHTVQIIHVLHASGLVKLTSVRTW